MEAAAQPPQHMQALERANKVRLGRAELKRAICRGDKRVIDVLEDLPAEADTMTLSELLCSQRRWGRTRTRKFLAPTMLGENKAIGTLTERQRKMLVAELRAKTST